MIDERNRSSGPRRSARVGQGPSPLLVWPLMLGFVAGSAAFAGYLYWSHHKAQSAAETTTETDLAKPPPAECAIAEATLTDLHASGEDAGWRASLGPLTLKAPSQVINPVDVTGYADDEADNLRGKAQADWRGCKGMGAFVRRLGWSAMSDDEDIAEIGLGRPGLSADGGEAKVYEMVGAPQAGSGALLLAHGPWVVTLRRDGAGWRVTGRADAHRQ